MQIKNGLPVPCPHCFDFFLQALPLVELSLPKLVALLAVALRGLEGLNLILTELTRTLSAQPVPYAHDPRTQPFGALFGFSQLAFALPFLKLCALP